MLSGKGSGLCGYFVRMGQQKQEVNVLICNTNSGQCRMLLLDNCYSMLTQLCRRYGRITVWVDSICINQLDDDEKAKQLNHMARIYERAKSVVIWLGEGNEQSDRIIDCFTSAWRFGSTPLANLGEETMIQWLASRLMRHYIFNLLYQRSWEFSGQGHSLQRILITLLLNSRHLRKRYRYQDLESLLQNGWMKRSWTFQEFILAQRPVILCGRKAIGWPNFVFTLGFLQLQASRNNTPLPPCLTGWQSLAGLWATVDWYRRHHEPDKTITIWGTSDHMDEQNLAGNVISAFAMELFRRICSLQKHYLKIVWEKIKIFCRRLRYQMQRSFDHSWSRVGNGLFLLDFVFTIFAIIFAWAFNVLAVTIWIFVSLLVLLFPWTILVVAPLAVAIWMTVWKHLWYPIPCVGLFWAKLSLFPYKYYYIGRYRLLEREPQRLSMRSIPRPPEPRLRPSRPLPSRPSYPTPVLQQPFPSRLARAIQTPPDKVFKQGLVEAIRQRECSEPRDKAYAVHSILDLAGIKHQTVDNGRPVPIVFRNLFVELLQSSPDFAVLLLDAGMRSTQWDTTWVPDWTNNGPRTWLDVTYVQFKNWHSATSSPANDVGFTFVGQTQLNLYGHWTSFCKDVYLCENTSLTMKDVQREWLALRDWLRAASYSGPAEIANGGERRKIDVHQVLRGSLLESEDTIPDSLTQLLRYVKSPSSHTLPGDLKIRVWIHECLNDLRARRSLFITGEGYIGSGPLEMRQGDQIALVAHVPVPLVFRNSEFADGTYQLVGPAFVAGIMKGEAWGEHIRRETICVV